MIHQGDIRMYEYEEFGQSLKGGSSEFMDLMGTLFAILAVAVGVLVVGGMVTYFAADAMGWMGDTIAAHWSTALITLATLAALSAIVCTTIHFTVPAVLVGFVGIVGYLISVALGS